MKKWILILILCAFSIHSVAEDALFFDEVSIGLGESKDNISIYRLAARKDFETIFHESDYGWFTGYYEASLNYWEKEGDEIYAIALSPVFVYYIGSKTDTIHPYIEAGIGIAGLSDTKIKGRDMASNFQFEDRIGLGIRTESYNLSVRYMHYSNAGIEKPNDGIDIFIGTISYRF